VTESIESGIPALDILGGPSSEDEHRSSEESASE